MPHPFSIGDRIRLNRDLVVGFFDDGSPYILAEGMTGTVDDDTSEEGLSVKFDAPLGEVAWYIESQDHVALERIEK